MRKLKFGEEIVKKLALTSIITLTTLTTLTVFGTMAFAESTNMANTMNTEGDEFSELLSAYESKAPTVEVAELSSTFTSSNEIEVYLKTNRVDIEKVVISGWSGGAYSKYATTKKTSYDELRKIYTTTFQLNNIVNTETGAIDNLAEATFSFDAIVYSTNGTSTYVRLDNVQYAESGFVTELNKTQDGSSKITLTAEKEGYIAIVQSGDELTEETTWMKAEKGTNTYTLENKEETTEYVIYYKKGEEITTTSLTIAGDEVVEGSSCYQNDELYTFDISENSGKYDWMSYEDTPNIFESTIQGQHGATATAEIKITADYPGILSFDYMVSSEKEFDYFKFEITGATETSIVKQEKSYQDTFGEDKEMSGTLDWKSFEQSYAIPTNGVLTLKLTYTKDKNVNRLEDKAAIRNLIFTPILPTNGKVIINGGEEYTTDTLLNLEISVEDATYMYITENNIKPSANEEGWVPLADRMDYILENIEDGIKTIYVWFRNNSGAMSLAPAIDTIKLDNDIPTTTAPTLESAAHEITVRLNQTDANALTSIEYGYRLANSLDEFEWTTSESGEICVIKDLIEMEEYEIKTRVSDGLHEIIESESSTITTKIPSDKIVITSSPSEKTLENVIVTIEWNNTEYTQSYSLDGINWTIETNSTTSIEMPENGTIYYQMYNDMHETGIQKYVVENIDRIGPRVEKAEIVSPKTGTYGIGDEITIELTYDEDIYVTSLPALNIRFDDDNDITVLPQKQNGNTIKYVYTIGAADFGYLRIISVKNGMIKDEMGNISTEEILPQQEGNVIYVENTAYIAETNTYYATLQDAINAVGKTPTTIQIVANAILREKTIIYETQDITIDLNGNTLKIENADAIVTAIENGGRLKITDTSENPGEVKAISSTRSAYTIQNGDAGILTVENGKISAISNTDLTTIESYAIYNRGAGVVTLGKDDEEISEIMPEIVATAKNSIGIKLVSDEGTLNYYDGIIKGTTKSLNMAGGANAYTLPVGYMEIVDVSNENNIEYEVSHLSNEKRLELTMNGETSAYRSVLEALDKIPNDGRLGIIKLYQDITLENIAKIYNGQNVELDLNGYTITSRNISNKKGYAIINNGTLRIIDTSGNKNGAIRTLVTNDVTAYGIYNYTNGRLTLDGGKYFAYIDVEYSTAKAYGIYNGSNEKINFNDGVIYRHGGAYMYSNEVITPENLYMNQRIESINEIEYKVSFLSENPVVSMDISGDITYYSGLSQAMEVAPKNENLAIIKMIQNEEIQEGLITISGQNLVLDLNGKTIKAVSISKVIQIVADSACVIRDNSETKNGEIYCTNADGVILNSGITELNDITIKTYDGNINYGIIYNFSNGKLKVNSGTYNSWHTVNTSNGLINYGEIEINGGNISAYDKHFTNSSSYGLYIGSTDKIVTINGGEFLGGISGIYVPKNAKYNNNGNIEIGKINLPYNMHIDYRLEKNASAQYAWAEKNVVNFVAEGESVVELDISGETTYHLSIFEALNNVPKDGTLARIKLLYDCNLPYSIEISEEQNIEIDLNGKKFILI